MSISAIGMALPFGLGAAVAVPIYNNFLDTDAVSFGHFLLFVGVGASPSPLPRFALLPWR